MAATAVAALVWRVAYTLASHGSDTELFDEGDAFLYSAVAHNTAAGNWFQNPFDGSHFADHPPLTVAALTPTSWLFRDSVLAQRLTMTVLGVAAVVAIAVLAKRAAGPVAGLAAGFCAAVNANLWMNDALIMSESVSALLIAVLLWAVLGLARSPTPARAVAVGALCGLTVLARAEVGLFLPLLVAPVLLTADLAWKQRLGRLAASAGALLVVLAPWTAWNLTEFSEPVLISTNDGTTLLGANCPPVYAGTIMGGWSLQCVLEFNEAQDVAARGLDASEISVLQRREAVDYATANADRWPALLVAREGRTFGWWRPDQQVYANTGEGRPEWASWTGFVTFWILIPVAVFGAVALRRRGGSLLPAVACLATVVIVSGLFYGIPRFRLPLDVITCVLAGVAVAALVDRRRPPPDPDPDGAEPASDRTASGVTHVSPPLDP